MQNLGNTRVYNPSYRSNDVLCTASISSNASGDINTTYATLVFISCDADNKPIRGNPIISKESYQ